MNHVAVLASGTGTNLQAIIDACESGYLPDSAVSIVVCNRRKAYALQRAKRHGIPYIYHPRLPYRRDGELAREQYDADLAKMMSVYPVDLIAMAGWMHIFTRAFLKHYPSRVINIHPALSGTFPGLHAIERAYQAYQKGEIEETGVMVHYAPPDEGVDEGPLIEQRHVPIHPDDTLEELEERIHAVEHELYVYCIAKLLGVSLDPSRAPG